MVGEHAFTCIPTPTRDKTCVVSAHLQKRPLSFLRSAGGANLSTTAISAGIVPLVSIHALPIIFSLANRPKHAAAAAAQYGELCAKAATSGPTRAARIPFGITWPHAWTWGRDHQHCSFGEIMKDSSGRLSTHDFGEIRVQASPSEVVQTWAISRPYLGECAEGSASARA